MASGYHYHSLGNAEQVVRFLTFDNRKSGADEPLICSLQHTAIRNLVVPEFYAVSYTWGEASRRNDLLVDGKRINIPRSAEVALRHFLDYLHNEDRTTSRIRIWIDCICIDHSNAKEKRQQLTLMREIYSRAKQVLIWLGPDDDRQAEEAVRSILDVVIQCKRETNGLNDLLAHLWTSEKGKVYPRTSTKPLPASCNLSALRAFYSTPWLTRLWVVQEASLAKEALCFRGSSIVPLDDIALAAQWMWHRGRGKLSPEDTISSSHAVGIRNATEIWDCLEANPYRSSKSIWTMLAMGMEFQTTDPMDRVYGMLGMLQERYMRMVPDLKYLVPDDHALTQADLYTRATRAGITDSWSLSILSIASRAVNPKPSETDKVEAPSWVPRFDWVLDFSKGSPYPIRARGLGASTQRPMQWRELQRLPSILTVQGVKFDNIIHEVSVSSKMLEQNTPRDIASKLANLWSITQTLCAAEHYDSLEMAFAITLCTGQSSTMRDIIGDKSYVSYIAAFFEACASHNRPIKPFAEHFKALVRDQIHSHSRKDSTQNDDSVQTPAAAIDPDEYRTAISHGFHSRKYFITSKGRLGLGPKSLETYDSICLLPGYAVPVVLRKEGIFWRFLGDAYVYGIMDGLWFRDLQAHGQLEERLRWFHIQ